MGIADDDIQTVQSSMVHSLGAHALPMLSRTSSMELLRPVSSLEAADGASSLPQLRRRAFNLSIDTSSEFGAIVDNVISPELTTKEATTFTPPAFVRAPSGNSFASMPFQMERVPSLSRVPSGLSQISVDLNAVDSSAPRPRSQPPRSNTPPAPSLQLALSAAARPQVAAAQLQPTCSTYVYDTSVLNTPILEKCESEKDAQLQFPVPAATQSLEAPMFVTRGALGPFGPYNPPPAWMQTPVPKPAAAPKALDEFEGKQVIMVRGKYKGKSAFVQRKVNKKYRLQVEGVSWGLEFYSNMFALPGARAC